MKRPTPAPYRLHVLGTRELTTPEGTRVSSVLAQPKRLCLLTYLALARGPVSRSSLTGLFWPESDEPKARNALSQGIFYLRRSLTKDLVQSVEGDRVWVSPDRLWCDARELLLADEPDPETLRAAQGELLAGWNSEDSQPLQEWLDATRREARRRGSELAARRRSSPAAPSPRATPPSAPGSSGAWAAVGLGRYEPWIRALTAAAVVLVIGIVAGRTVFAPEGPARAAERPGARAVGPAALGDRDLPATTLLVVDPTLVSSGTAPSGLVDAIRVAVVSELSGLSGLEVREAVIPTDRTNLDRMLAAIGQDEPPDLVVQIVVVLTRGEFRTRALLSGRAGVAEDFANAGFEYRSVDELLTGAPGSVALAVSDMVQAALEERTDP